MLEIDDATLEGHWELEQAYLKRSEDCSRPDAAGPALKRLADSVLKVAALLAIDESEFGEVPTVRPAYLFQASLMGARWIKSTLQLIDALGRTGFQQDCEAVLGTIRTRPNGIRVRDLYRRHRKLKKRDFEEILSALRSQDEIRTEESKDASKGPAFVVVIPTGGRP
jgi:hypothetical protein